MSEDRKVPFSERGGHVKIKEIQIKSLDAAVRTRLWNLVFKTFSKIERLSKFEYLSHSFLKPVWVEFLNEPIDQFSDASIPLESTKDFVMQEDWYRVFDLIEFILDNWASLITMDMFFAAGERKHEFIQKCNVALKTENVGYRISEDLVTPITSEMELQSINRAIHGPFQGASEAIKKAHVFLSSRPEPDCVKSIEESISAIEFISTEIAGENKLSKAVGKLKSRGVQMHPQFECALENLFNFSSKLFGGRHRTGGQRVPTTGEPLRADEHTATFVLITCSAFVNYITAEYTKTKQK